MDKELNQRQKAFCDFYLQSGNATQSYLAAGYKVSPEVAAVKASELVRIGKVQEYIAERQKQVDKSRIADIEEVQQFWAEVMRDKEAGNLNRLKASELIAKAQGMFTERVQLGSMENSKVIFEIVRKKKNADKGSENP